MVPFDPNAAAAPGSGVYGLDDSPDRSAVVLLPAPFEATTSYGGGTAGGPAAILEASHQVDLWDAETGRPYESGIAWLPEPEGVARWNREALELARPIIEAGGARGSSLADNARQVDAYCDRMNGAVRAIAAEWSARGKLVGLVGGDHSTAFGAIAAASEAHPGLGILHVDAHADLRRDFEGFAWSHASIMENVSRRLPGVARIVQVAVRDLCEEEHEAIERSGGRIVTHHDSDLARNALEGRPFAEWARAAVSLLPDAVYLSFDIDGLDPALCPHTGTPVPGGLSFREACHLLRAVVHAGKRIVGFDLTEVAPGPPGNCWDANVAARLLYKMIGWALLSRRDHSISKE